MSKSTSARQPVYPPASRFAEALPLPDLRRRALVVAYLLKHDRHCDHLEPFKFSNDVKVHSLNIPFRLRDQAWAVLAVEIESGEIFPDYNLRFEDFEAEYDTVVSFAGRSGGHIVLHSLYGNDSPSQLRALPMKELQSLARLVHAFDQLCDECVAAFMEKVTNYEIVTEEIEVTHTVSVTSLKAKG